MCKAFRFMSLDWRDLFDEIDDLSLGAQLAVVKLIGKGWHRGAPLPDDNAKIARMLAVQVRTWLKIRVEIEGLFDLSEGAWNHHQFKRARQHAECRAKAGSRSQTPENSPKVCDFPDHKPWETNNRSPHKNKDKAIKIPWGLKPKARRARARGAPNSPSQFCSTTAQRASLQQSRRSAARLATQDAVPGRLDPNRRRRHSRHAERPRPCRHRTRSPVICKLLRRSRDAICRYRRSLAALG